MKALILEDDPICAAAARALFTRLGYAVITRQSVSAARGAHLADDPIDLYLIDVNVPVTAVSKRNGSGLLYARWVLYRHPKARVIVWSADDHSEATAKVGALFVLKGANVMGSLERAVRGT